MSGRIGYDLERVRHLRRDAVQACALLDALRCDDPAAVDAAAALRRLRDVIERGWLPTIDAIIRNDPLGTAWTGTGAGATGLLGGDGADTVAGLHPASPWRTASNTELFAALDRIDGAMPWVDPGLPDLERLLDSEFAAIATAIADRAASSPSFAGLLVDRFESTPLIGLVALVAPYPALLSAELVAAGLTRTSYVDDFPTRSHAAAVAALLDSVRSDPDVVLDMLDETVVNELVRWPFLDPELVGEVVLTGLLVPVRDPDRLGDGHAVLRHLVGIANDPFVDRTSLPSPIAAALAAGTSVYLPTFVTSLEPGDVVNLKDHDGRNLGDPLGSYEEVLDYIGLLLRDPEAASILVASLRPLTVDAIVGDTGTDVADVGDLAIALANAAENERLEDRLHAAAVRSLVERITIAVGIVAGVGAATLRFGPTARALLAQLVDRWGGTVASAASDDRSAGGPIDAAAAGEMMIEIAVYETFLSDPLRFVDDETGLGPGALAAARAQMGHVHEIAAAGADVAEIERALQDVHVEIIRAGGGRLLDSLDHGAIAELDHHDTGIVDLDRPLDG